MREKINDFSKSGVNFNIKQSMFYKLDFKSRNNTKHLKYLAANTKWSDGLNCQENLSCLPALGTCAGDMFWLCNNDFRANLVWSNQYF